ncbi:hypothetical protein JT359_08665 [Candidatus Poribacteria bacterium]|nr:hypothetical protein [Candidatus Poribacteria bacterium]
MKRIWIPQAIIIPLLLLALNPDNPYGYYVFLRWVCCAVFIFLAIHALSNGKIGWVWMLGVTGLIYNPIIIVPGTREMWTILNLITIILAIISIFILKSDESNDHNP